MKIYEGMFVLDDARANDNWDRVVAEVRRLLEKHQARVFHLDRWDERRLAYRIKGRNRAVYAITHFTAPGDAIPHIERDCQLNDTILRVLIVRDHETEKQHRLGLFNPDAPRGEAEQPGEPPATEAAPPAQAPAPEGQQGEGAPSAPQEPQAETPQPRGPSPDAQPPQEGPSPDTQ